MYLIVCFLQEGDDPRLFKCRWCKVRFTRGLRTHYNIYAHCDRAKGQSAFLEDHAPHKLAVNFLLCGLKNKELWKLL